MTEFISITIICIIIYEVLILLSFKKLIVENINIYKKFINLLSNKNIDDNKKEYYFLNTSKLLFITSLKLLFILLILIIFFFVFKFTYPRLFEIFFHFGSFLKITIIILIYNYDQYLDQKFRKIQAMFCLLQNIHQKQNENTYIIAECEIVSYKSGFVNILITHIISNLTYSKLNINLSCSFWKKKNVNTGHFKIKITTMNLYSYQNDLYIPFTQSGKIKDNEVFPEIYQQIQEL